MTRLVCIVEGQTEGTFVQNTLEQPLYTAGYHQVWPILMGNPTGERSGGIRSWDLVRSDIERWLIGSQDLVVTTMVDYYGMPDSWPGRAQARLLRDISLQADTIQRAMLADITQRLPNIHPRRFVPYVMMHEFEALLFSDPERFAMAIRRPELAPHFWTIRNGFPTPEHINDSRLSHPSARILAKMPEYQKVLLGNRAAEAIGLTTIRQECRLFHRWLDQLESLPPSIT